MIPARGPQTSFLQIRSTSNSARAKSENQKYLKCKNPCFGNIAMYLAIFRSPIELWFRCSDPVPITATTNGNRWHKKLNHWIDIDMQKNSFRKKSLITLVKFWNTKIRCINMQHIVSVILSMEIFEITINTFGIMSMCCTELMWACKHEWLCACAWTKRLQHFNDWTRWSSWRREILGYRSKLRYLSLDT